MHLDVQENAPQECVWVAIRSHLAAGVVSELKAFTASLQKGSFPSLVLDFKDVSYVDSAGLGTLISIHKAWHRFGRAFVIVNVSASARKFMATTGLLGALNVAARSSDVTGMIQRLTRESNRST